MRVHLVSEHASPLRCSATSMPAVRTCTSPRSSKGLARSEPTWLSTPAATIRTSPRQVRLETGVIVDHVDAGPPEPIPKDEMLPFMTDFADDLERSGGSSVPMWCTPTSGCRGLPLSTPARLRHPGRA